MGYTRLHQIYEAASKLFIQQGYAKTVIADIAKAIGVSVGTIYQDFTGKKAIKYFVLRCTIDPDFIDRNHTLPLSDDLAVGLEDDIKRAFDEMEADFSAPLLSGAGDYAFEQLLSDAFDIMSRYAAGCLFIEKNPDASGALAGYYKTYRQKFFATMQAYLELFSNRGVLRPAKHPAYVVHIIIETISWWTMDRRYNAFEPLELSHEVAKEVVLDNLVAAYKR